MIVTRLQRDCLVEAFNGMRGTGEELTRLGVAYDELGIGTEAMGTREFTPSLGTILVLRGFEQAWPRSVQIDRAMASLFAQANAMVKQPGDLEVVGVVGADELAARRAAE